MTTEHLHHVRKAKKWTLSYYSFFYILNKLFGHSIRLSYCCTNKLHFTNLKRRIQMTVNAASARVMNKFRVRKDVCLSQTSSEVNMTGPNCPCICIRWFIKPTRQDQIYHYSGTCDKQQATKIIHFPQHAGGGVMFWYMVVGDVVDCWSEWKKIVCVASLEAEISTRKFRTW